MSDDIEVAYDERLELVKIIGPRIAVWLYPGDAATLGGKLLELTRVIDERTPPETA